MDSSSWAVVQGVTGIGCFILALVHWVGITPATFRRGERMPLMSGERSPVWTGIILTFSLTLFAGSSYQSLHLAFPRATWAVLAGFVVLAALMWVTLFNSGKSALLKAQESLRESAARNLQYKSQLEAMDQSHKDHIRRMEIQHNSELENSREAYRQCMLERGAAMKGAEESMAKLALLTPLQLESISLSKEICGFVDSFEPIPSLLPPSESDTNKLKNRMDRMQWRERFKASFTLRFEDRLKNLELKFKEVGIRTDFDRLVTDVHDPAKRSKLRAAALIGMAFRLDNILLDVVPI